MPGHRRRLRRFAKEADGATRVLVGRDMRPTGVEFAGAFAEGVQGQGLDVVDLGLASTDLVYFASGRLDAPAAMFTASHNPANYNGIKFCLTGAEGGRAVDTGLDRIKAMVRSGVPAAPTEPGQLTGIDMLDDFAEHVRSFIDVSVLVPLKVVADTANGMGGLVVPAVFAKLPFELDLLYGELDGSFPNHPADPIQVENQADLRARVLETGADVGLAFDGDADRVFVVDEKGEPISGSTTTAMVAAGILDKEPGATDPAQPDLLEGRARDRAGEGRHPDPHQGRPLLHQGGHGRHRRRLRWRALGALLLPRQLAGRLRAHRRDARPRAAQPRPAPRCPSCASRSTATPMSGEINTKVDDPLVVIEHVAGAFPDADQDRLDGLTVDLGTWWFNLRPSNTEPLLRLNLEAPDRAACDAHVAEVLALITAEPGD